MNAGLVNSNEPGGSGRERTNPWAETERSMNKPIGVCFRDRMAVREKKPRKVPGLTWMLLLK
jgi:hypothetical protein